MLMGHFDVIAVATGDTTDAMVKFFFFIFQKRYVIIYKTVAFTVIFAHERCRCHCTLPYYKSDC